MFETKNKILENIILVGNPNVGKSVIFGKLTGQYVNVSNYPGTTVDISKGVTTLGNKDFQIIDTPGVNSIIPRSEDEEVTRDLLFKTKTHNVLVVTDSKNLSRGLLLTLQILEIGSPVILNLNMMDEAKERGILIDTQKLSYYLDIKVIETTATTGEGLSTLKKSLSSPTTSTFKFDYGKIIENSINKISSLLPDNISIKRSVCSMILSGDETIWDLFEISNEIKEKIDIVVEETQKNFSQPLNIIILSAQQKKAQEILNEIISIEGVIEPTWNEKISELTLKPATGIPIFMVIIYLIYKLVGNFGAGILVDFMEKTFFGKFINPPIINFVSTHIPSELFQSLLIGKYGLLTMALTYAIAIVLPIMITFFLAFGFLEDSGYLPRLTVMADRVFRLIGLTGKAVLPFVLGLGCGTMACMTTRILDSKKERILATLLIALGIPCSAQLGVMLGITSTLPGKASVIIWGTIILQIFIVGFVASKLIPGERSLFFIELPPIRIPQMYNVLMKTYHRTKWFLLEAIPLFFLGTLFLFVIDRIGFLSLLQILGAPLMEGVLGLPPETVSVFILGFLRRDYGAAGLYRLAQQGLLNPTQIVVSIVVITLFVPCITSFFIMIKERGAKVAIGIMGFVTIYAFLIGGFLNFILHFLNISI